MLMGRLTLTRITIGIGGGRGSGEALVTHENEVLETV